MRRMLMPAVALGAALLFGAAATPAHAQSQVFHGGQVITPVGGHHGHHRGHYRYARPYAVVPRAHSVQRYHGHHHHRHAYAGHRWGHAGRRW